MNEAQKLMNQVAIEEAFKVIIKDLPMTPEIERLCRTVFFAGWHSNRKVAGVDKALRDVG